jgi:hypothetical protein
VQHDFATAWKFLKAGKRFYRILEDGFNIEYLFELLRPAKIWRESGFWESAFQDMKSEPNFDNAFAAVSNYLSDFLK